MPAPHTSLTIPQPISDMTGVMYERLYLSIRLTAMTSILASEQILFSVGPDSLNSLETLVDCIAYAVAVEVVQEIKNHSNLIPIVTDVPPFGAGIIKGSVA